jgi:hypothetical protein
MPEEKQEVRNGEPEKKKEEIAKTYGIDLAQIQHIKIENGSKEFLKFMDPKDRSVKLVALFDRGINAQSSFENSQKGLSSAHGDDNKENAREVFEHDMNYKYNVVNLTSMSEFKSNMFKYKKILRQLDTITRKKIKAIIKGSKKGNISLKYISFDYAIGIDENGNAIEAEYDYATNKAIVKGVKPENTKDHNFNLEDDIETVQISEEELNSVFENITITPEGPTLISDKNVNIKGEEISTKTVVDLYNMPELMNKLNLDAAARNIYNFILGVIIRKAGAKQITKNEPVKERVLEMHTNNTNTEDKAA